MSDLLRLLHTHSNKNLSVCANPKWASMLPSQPEHDLRQRRPPPIQPQRQQAPTPTKPPPPPPPHPSPAEHPSLVSDNPYPKTPTYTTSPRSEPPPTTSSPTAYPPPHPKPRGDAFSEGKRSSSSKESSREESLKTSSKDRLSDICRSHHGSIINLLGASVSDHIYLVYEYVNGASLADCLRNPKNPNFTVLSNWTSRIQIATDLAHGLDYIHNKTGLKIENLVHNHIKSSAVIVTEPDFNARICHFGTAQLCGETDGSTRGVRFEGVRGYMSPEFQGSGVATQRSDVFAFGVMMLELLSGEEPLKYRYDKSTGDFERTSVIETARAVVVVMWRGG